MMKTAITREQAYALLRKYNQDPFHLRHGRTVEEGCATLPGSSATARRRNSGAL